MSEASDIFRKQFQARRLGGERRTGVTFAPDGGRSAAVPGRPGYVYVRMPMGSAGSFTILQVRSDGSPEAQVPVHVEIDPLTAGDKRANPSGEYRIAGIDMAGLTNSGYTGDSPSQYTVGPHAPSHELGGLDVLNLNALQIVQLRVEPDPDNGNGVVVREGVLVYNGRTHTREFQTYHDLTLNFPAPPGGTKFVWIVIDPSRAAESVTAATISLSGSTISDSAAGFGGFAAGDTIQVSGSASNDGVYYVTAASASALTVRASLATEGAGGTVTILADRSARVVDDNVTIYEQLEDTWPGTAGSVVALVRIVYLRGVTWADIVDLRFFQRSSIGSIMLAGPSVLHDSQLTLYPSIQDALNATVDGDEAWIPPGVYDETAVYNLPGSIALGAVLAAAAESVRIAPATGDALTVGPDAGLFYVSNIQVHGSGASYGLVVNQASINKTTHIIGCDILGATNALSTAGATNYWTWIDRCRVSSGVNLVGFTFISDTIINGNLTITSNGETPDENRHHELRGGKVVGNVTVGAGAVLELRNLPTITGTVSGQIRGHYQDAEGHIRPVPWPHAPALWHNGELNVYGSTQAEIQAAIDVGVPGDEVLFPPGLYDVGYLYGRPGVNLVGLGAASDVIVRGAGTNLGTLKYWVIGPGAGSVGDFSIDGLTIQNSRGGSGSALANWTPSKITATNCNLSNYGSIIDTCVSLEGGSIDLVDCNLSGAQNGVWFNDPSSVVTIRGGTNSCPAAISDPAGGTARLHSHQYSSTINSIGTVEYLPGDRLHKILGYPETTPVANVDSLVLHSTSAGDERRATIARVLESGNYRTVRVEQGGGATYSTIQDAIDSLPADTTGWVIKVGVGVFVGFTLSRTNVVIAGAGGGRTAITGTVSIDGTGAAPWNFGISDMSIAANTSIVLDDPMYNKGAVIQRCWFYGTFSVVGGNISYQLADLAHVIVLINSIFFSSTPEFTGVFVQSDFTRYALGFRALLHSYVQVYLQEADGNVDVVRAYLALRSTATARAQGTITLSGTSPEPVLDADDSALRTMRTIVPPGYNWSGIKILNTFTAGLLSPAPTYTNNLAIDGTVLMSAAVASLYSHVDGPLLPLRFDVSPQSIALADGQNNYAYVDYNNHSPVYGVSTSEDAVDWYTKILVATLYREGTAVYPTPSGLNGERAMDKVIRRLVELSPFGVKPGGMALGVVAGTRYVTLTPAIGWFVLSRENYVNFNSQTSGHVLEEWYLVGGVWTKSIVTQINNTEYATAGVKAAMGPNKFSTRYLWRSATPDETEVMYILGEQYNTVELARAEPIPSLLPAKIQSHGILVGRMIIGTGEATPALIESAFTTTLSVSSVTSHDALSNVRGGAPSPWHVPAPAAGALIVGQTSPTQDWVLLPRPTGVNAAGLVLVAGQSTPKYVDPITASLPWIQSFDTFDIANWTQYTGGGIAALAVGDGQCGGNVLRCTGQVWLIWNRLFPYDPNTLYCMSIRVRQFVEPTGGSSFRRVFCGFVGVKGDGVTLINAIGNSAYDSQHYFASGSSQPATSAAWTVFTGYASGAGGTYLPNASNPLNPSSVNSEVRYFRPLLLVNYSGGDGVADVDAVLVQAVGPADLMSSMAHRAAFFS